MTRAAPASRSRTPAASRSSPLPEVVEPHHRRPRARSSRLLERRGGRVRVGHQRGEHEPDLAAARAARPATPPRRRARPRRPSAPSRRRRCCGPARRAAAPWPGSPSTSMHCPTTRAVPAGAPQARRSARRAAARGCRRTAAAADPPTRPRSARTACAAPRRPRPWRWRPGCGRSRCRASMPDSWLTTACQRGRCSVASLASASTRRARGSPIRSTNCSKIAGTAPERLDARHVLAGQHQVDALRAAAPGDVLQQPDGLAGDRVPLGEEELELVDHRDDPRPAPLRVGRRAAPRAW